MRPTFEDASRVWIEEGGQARFGDILVYRDGSFLVVHRVVSLLPRRVFRTKGDGIPHLDRELATIELVLGRVVTIERGNERYRTDGPGGRFYGRLVASLSALEGFLYRFAWRLDRMLTPRGHPEAASGGRPTVRRALTRAGRAAIGLLDRALFLVLNRREPPA